MFIILYAKVVDDKKNGPVLSGIYVGGARYTEEDADKLATRCVSETQGGMIIPKVMELRNDDFMYTIGLIQKQFYKMVVRMKENFDIMNR
jgi:hypothetical protein